MPLFSKNTLSPYWLILLTCIFLLLFAGTTQAQESTDESTENTIEIPEAGWPEDSLGRRSPRGAVAGFIKAVAAEDYTRAAHFLNLDEEVRQSGEGANIAQSLQRLLDRSGNIIPYSWMSNEPEGLSGDNLSPTLDRIGTATVKGETFDIYVEKIEGPSGGPVWLFSAQTVQRIPASIDEISGPMINTVLPAYLQNLKWGGVPVGHWLALVLMAVLAYLLAWAISWILQFLIPFFWRQARTQPIAGVIKAFALPFRIYLSVWLFVAANQFVGISIIVRQRLSEFTIIVGLIALLILLWRLTGFLARYSEKLMLRRGNMAGVSAVLFFSRLSKAAIVAFGAIAIFYTFGFDVTTGLAALGIGGLALALGAQKTIENFVGSVTLIADQPIRVGDFCKVGETVGTVESIGMRSTRIRTLDRTVVTIPNGEFSSQRIENFAHRDRFRFAPVLGLRFETTPDQIRYLLVELRAILYAHPQVDPDPARIRFMEIGADSLNLEIFSYVHAADFSQYLEVKEDLLLRIMDVIEASGTGFAFPSQTVYFAKDAGLSSEKTKAAEARVKQWRKEGKMQIPNFEFDRIQDLRNTIIYPPEGSVQQNGKAEL